MRLRNARPMDIGSSHVIVTGGSSGIGLATARLLAARGARLSLIARGAERLEAAAKEVSAAPEEVPTASKGVPAAARGVSAAARGVSAAARRGSVAARAADVADQAALTRAIAELEEEQAQPCDILITSAGLARPGHFLELPDEVFRQMIEVDYFGTLHAIRAVAPGMVERGHGSVVAVSSAAGLLGIFGYSAYGPAKFAVRGLMESVRAELTPRGVHVGVVFPPDVDTPQLAEENRWKPRETRVVGGTIKPLTAEKVAAALVKGIDQRRFTICPDTGTRALSRFGSVLMPLLNLEFDRRVRAVQRSATPG
ncbi:SDR family oxidoreductase [Streptomyces sp. DSM 40750]|uniref:SDR family oxidoreductase n=1 Tax=Streptomyces sp. DSM 40750 TaxID=2801030 RepID=UPI00214C7A3C|nr:SDR family oxidoreductase [Streptomyces sp. DSM 40750]UUU26350.1 SDR family oxidoreductase [Streptomyces sp. DSM 40750]